MPDKMDWSNGSGINIEDEARSIWDDLLWPFSFYLDVRDFVGRMASASLTITLMGFILADLGISPGISGAVSMLGLAVSVSEVFLRVVFNLGEGANPLERIGAGKRVSGFILYLIIGFVMFLFIGGGSVEALKPSLYQYVIGIAVTGVAGAIFMRVYSVLQEDGVEPRYKIGASIGITLGAIFVMFLALPYMLELLNQQPLLDIIEQQPKDLANTSFSLSSAEIGG